MSKQEAGQSLNTLEKVVEGVAKPCIKFLTVAVPFVIVTGSKLYIQFKRLPQNVLLFIYGFIFCFFGGLFPTLFAAIQAAEYGGRKTFILAIEDLTEEALVIIEESKKDDKKDDDKDGKADIDQISSTEYLVRKTRLVLKKMNPEKVDKAISSMYRIWLAVAAVLSIKFARTISMALAIADFLKKPCDRFLAPTISKIMPNEYSKWVPIVLGWITKGIAVSIAWYIKSIISAFTSALTGGLMMARAVYQFCVERKINLFGLISEDHTASNADEVLSYLFAGAGFYMQFRLGFKLPFPLNLILWPFQMAEWWIRWTVSK